MEPLAKLKDALARLRLPGKRALVAIVAASVVVAGIVAYLASSGGSGASASGQTVIYSTVQPRDLQNTIVISGTLGHKDVTTVEAQSAGFVTSIEAKANQTINAGDTLFSLNGRAAIAEKGSLPFFRSLGPGDVGADVLELKQILAAAGDNPGSMDDVFTQQTQAALAQWQAQHGYPSANPASTEALTVALQQGVGYQVGAQSTAGLTIGPPGGDVAAGPTSPGAPPGALAANLRKPRPAALGFVPAGIHLASIPVVSVSGSTSVLPGGTATITVSLSCPSGGVPPCTFSTTTEVYLNIGGSAQAGVDYSPVNPVVSFAPGTTQVNVIFNTLPNQTIGPNKFIDVTVSPSPTASYLVGEPSSATVTISEPTGIVPTVTLTSTATYITKGQPFPVTVGLSQAVSTALTLNLSYGGSAQVGIDYQPPSGLIQVPPGQTQFTVEIPTIASNQVEGDVTLTVSLAASSAYNVGFPSSATVTIHDPNVPQLTITGSTSIQPGQTATLTVTANQAPVQNTQVVLSLAGSAQAGTDYDPPDPVLILPAGSTSASVTIQTLVTQTFEPSRYLVVSIAQSASGSYTVASPGSAVVTILGATPTSAPPILTLSSPITYLHKGSPYEIVLGLSAPAVVPITVLLGFSGSAQAGIDFNPPSGSVTIPPGQTSFEVSIPTITDNLVESDRTLIVSLEPSNEYQMGVPNQATVTITSLVVPTITISTSSSNLTEGQDATITFIADQAPVKDTSINFTIVGTAQPGQDYVPLAGSVILPAGQTSVTVTFQSIEKDVIFEPTDMIVANWPIRVGQVYVKQGQTVTPGEPLVDLTQPKESVTLQASPSDFTQLAIGQSCTMTISGGQSQLSGVITELDSNPTILSGSGGSSGGSSGQQVFEGQIEVSGGLSAADQAADGATVSITVTTQEVKDAMSVPIAAVKQNGTGQDVVRVVDLRHGGRIHEVDVTTGLTAGSYVQITGGLRMGDVVVVSVNQNQS
jgi:multidrug efflux pump subunit AcrA (membrane-fusion protein)